MNKRNQKKLTYPCSFCRHPDIRQDSDTCRTLECCYTQRLRHNRLFRSLHIHRHLKLRKDRCIMRS